MRPWDSLTIAEQTLMRRALSGYSLSGMVQEYGAALRWADAAEAPAQGSYTDDEQRALVPHLARVALELAQHGLLTLHEGDRPRARVEVTGAQLRAALTDPTNWLWADGQGSPFTLTAPQPVREQWLHDAYPVGDVGTLPTWEALSVAEREILVCAVELSGMLTGPFGIWDDLPVKLNPIERSARVDQQLAPLLPFVREGWIEVRHFPSVHSDTFTVIPLDDLHAAFADPAVRYEGRGNEWGIGIGCVFTYAGLAVWRGGWSNEWGRRLHFD